MKKDLVSLYPNCKYVGIRFDGKSVYLMRNLPEYTFGFSSILRMEAASIVDGVLFLEGRRVKYTHFTSEDLEDKKVRDMVHQSITLEKEEIRSRIFSLDNIFGKVEVAWRYKAGDYWRRRYFECASIIKKDFELEII